MCSVELCWGVRTRVLQPQIDDTVYCQAVWLVHYLGQLHTICLTACIACVDSIAVDNVQAPERLLMLLLSTKNLLLTALYSTS